MNSEFRKPNGDQFCVDTNGGTRDTKYVDPAASLTKERVSMKIGRTSIRITTTGYANCTVNYRK
ncbi:MAG: hypothetical protein ABI758_02450 [Candidatus Woesebacteria bacterium]